MKLSYDEVIEGNRELHRREARFYDRIHSEIWNKKEQRRLWNMLRFATSQIDNNTFEALDFGAGTGNVTGKLINLCFEVTALDISKEMCEVLKTKNRRAVQEGKLHILNVNIDKTQISRQFDLATCYSVLHHLPDYISTIEKILTLIKEGGILYVDHEPTKYVHKKIGIFERCIMFPLYLTKRLYDALYLRNFPKLDYTKADVNMTLDYEHIIQTLKRNGFSIIKFATYYSQKTWFGTPLNLLNKLLVEANEIVIIAKRASVARA